MDENYNQIGSPNSSEQKERQIGEWNNLPEVKKAGVKAIDITKETEIGNNKYRLLYFLAIVGVLGLLGLGIGGGYLGYSAWTGKLNATISNICSPVIPSCPAAVPCPTCNNNCGTTNVTCPIPIVNVFTNST